MQKSNVVSIFAKVFTIGAIALLIRNIAQAQVVRLEGNVNVSIVNSRGTASIERIANYSAYIAFSRIDVWAFTAPYAGSPLSGTSLFKYVVGDIPRDYPLSNVTTPPQQISALPDGNYYLALLVYNKQGWLCRSGSCPDTSTDTTYTGYYTTPATFFNVPGSLVCSGGTCNSSATGSVMSGGLYDGIYQWSPGNYLSLHQDGTHMIATIYFTNDGSFSFPAASGGGVLQVPQLDIFDLMGGQVTGSTVRISGTRFHRACNVVYDFTFNGDATITVSRISVSDSTAADSAGISCSAIVGAEATTLMVRKIRFNQ